LEKGNTEKLMKKTKMKGKLRMPRAIRAEFSDFRNKMSKKGDQQRGEGTETKASLKRKESVMLPRNRNALPGGKKIAESR